jgi:hypothetical protein
MSRMPNGTYAESPEEYVERLAKEAQPEPHMIEDELYRSKRIRVLETELLKLFIEHGDPRAMGQITEVLDAAMNEGAIAERYKHVEGAKEVHERYRFYLDEVGVKRLFEENAALRKELAEIKARSSEPLITLGELRAEMVKIKGLDEWTHMPNTTELTEEDFSDKSRVHNWRSYIKVEEWNRMTELQKLLAWGDAEKMAQIEEWD